MGPASCAQCNRCSMVCPHAVIRPVTLTADELAAAPEATKSVDLKVLKTADLSMLLSFQHLTVQAVLPAQMFVLLSHLQ